MGRAFMFMAFVWLIVTFVGNVVAGSVAVSTTHLTAAITDAEDNTIPATSTRGFSSMGIIDIEGERIGYSSTTAVAFEDSLTQNIVRGAGGTIAAAHPAGATVRTVQSAMMNSSMDYRVAVIADASGLWIAPTMAYQGIRLFLSFFVLPLSFLGTDLQVLSYLWGILVMGMIFVIGASLAGVRRV